MRHLVTLLIILITACNLSAQTVYITKTGAKYHRNDCRYISQSKIEVDLEEAVNRGYSPCSVCKPVIKDKAARSGEKIGAFKSENEGPKSENTQSVKTSQSVYITKTGTKYHKMGCNYLKYSSIEINLEEAKKRGYSTCSVCKPPQ